MIKQKKLEILYFFEYELGEVSREEEMTIEELLDLTYEYLSIQSEYDKLGQLFFYRCLTSKYLIQDHAWIKYRNAIKVIYMWLETPSQMRWYTPQLKQLIMRISPINDEETL